MLAELSPGWVRADSPQAVKLSFISPQINGSATIIVINSLEGLSENYALAKERTVVNFRSDGSIQGLLLEGRLEGRPDGLLQILSEER